MKKPMKSMVRKLKKKFSNLSTIKETRILHDKKIQSAILDMIDAINNIKILV